MNSAIYYNLGQRGRLGNQMFEIAMLYAYTEDNNFQGMTNQWSYLKNFPNVRQYIEMGDISSIMESLNPSHYQEPDDTFYRYNVLPVVKTNISFDGFFQSYKYFHHREKEIQKLFELPATVTQFKPLYVEQLKEYVSIHVRRTDYEEKHRMPLFYYQKAIEFMKSMGHTKFYVFSDDIKWCQKNLPFTNEVVIFSSGISDLEDLYLMSHCGHHIIANSTFSFWGAYLNLNVNKLVLRPERWTNDSSWDNKYQLEEHTPPTWIKIKCKE